MVNKGCLVTFHEFDIVNPVKVARVTSRLIFRGFQNIKLIDFLKFNIADPIWRSKSVYGVIYLKIGI